MPKVRIGTAGGFRACIGKVKYLTLEEALADRQDRPYDQYPYKCPWNDLGEEAHFHYGHHDGRHGIAYKRRFKRR